MKPHPSKTKIFLFGFIYHSTSLPNSHGELLSIFKLCDPLNIPLLFWIITGSYILDMVSLSEALPPCPDISISILPPTTQASEPPWTLPVAATLAVAWQSSRCSVFIIVLSRKYYQCSRISCALYIQNENNSSHCKGLMKH